MTLMTNDLNDHEQNTEPRMLALTQKNMVHPIIGVIQAGVYRGGWRLDVRIMDV